MAREYVLCPHCRESHGVTHCDVCQVPTGQDMVYLNFGSLPFDLQPPSNMPSNRSPVLCVPCARGERGPVDFIQLLASPVMQYPERVQTEPTAAA